MFLRRRSIIFITGIIILAFAGGVFVLQREKKPEYETVLAKRTSLVQEVSVTGRVKPSASVDLAFERGGKVASVFANVGNTVSRGQSLVLLDNAELSAQVAQASAGVASARADLSALEGGTRPEEIHIAETKKTNVEKSLADAQTNLANVQEKADVDIANLYNDVRDVLQDAYTKADDAINKQTDDLFSGDTSQTPQLTFTSDAQAKIDVEAGRLTAGNTLATFKVDIANVPSDTSGRDEALRRAERYVSSIRDFLVRLQDALNSAGGLSSTTLATYKTNVNTGRTNMNTVLAAINTKQQAIALQKTTNQSARSVAEAKVNDAKNALSAADSELILKRAGATSEQIASQKAKVQSAEANLAYVRAQLAKTTLSSPITGIVTKQSAKVGEIVSSNTPIVSLIVTSQSEIEAHVPEADIAKIHVGDVANVTLDAYGSGVIFPATVIAIDPAETIVDGVSTYTTTFQFTKDDARAKPGMTANIDIVVGKRDDALAIRERALFAKDNEKFVRILSGNGIVREVKVTTGLKGSDGMIEIMHGITEGDAVIVSAP